MLLQIIEVTLPPFRPNLLPIIFSGLNKDINNEILLKKFERVSMCSFTENKFIV